MGGEADFAGAAVGIAGRDAPYLIPELAERVGIEFGMGHSLVSGETAAAHAFGDHDPRGTEARQFKHRPGHLHQPGRTG